MDLSPNLHLVLVFICRARLGNLQFPHLCSGVSGKTLARKSWPLLRIVSGVWGQGLPTERRLRTPNRRRKGELSRNLPVGTNLVFLKHLESLVHEIGNQVFFGADGAKGQIVAFQLWEQDRLHLKGRSRFWTLRDVRKTRAGGGTGTRRRPPRGPGRVPAPSFPADRARSPLPLERPFVFLGPAPFKSPVRPSLVDSPGAPIGGSAPSTHHDCHEMLWVCRAM